MNRDRTTDTHRFLFNRYYVRRLASTAGAGGSSPGLKGVLGGGVGGRTGQLVLPVTKNMK